MLPLEALHYVEAGPRDAGPLLFLHGITGSRRYWFRRVRHLAGPYRLILPDLIGFGLSPKPHIRYEMPVFRDSVRALVEELGLAGRPLAIVAHSLGGLIALEYAARFPGEVRSIVILSLPRFRDPETAHALFWRGSPHYRRLLNEHSLAETLSQMRRSGLELTLRYLFRFPWSVLIDSHKFTFRSLTSTLECCLLNYQVDQVLPRLPLIPTLLIHGEQDSVAPLGLISDLPGRYPHFRLVTIPGTGHHVFLTHTRRCLDLITQFLQESRRVPGWISSLNDGHEVSVDSRSTS
jgi:pimeloyl-ACP methyl ester carboxylesterase